LKISRAVARKDPVARKFPPGLGTLTGRVVHS
jgi:hypothetical protein